MVKKTNALLKKESPEVQEEIIKNKKRLELFSRVTSSIASQLDPEKIADSIIDEVFSYSKPTAVSITICEKNQLHTVAGRLTSTDSEHSKNFKKRPPINIGDGVSGQAALTGKATWINDAVEKPDEYPVSTGRDRYMQAILAVPMTVRTKIIGVIIIAYDKRHVFTDEEVSTMEIVAVPAGYAIQNAQLFKKMKSERVNLSMIQESMQSGVTVNQFDGTLISINDAAKRLFGIKEDTVGKSILKILINKSEYLKFPIELDTTVPSIIRDVAAGKVVKCYMNVHDDSPRRIESYFAPLRSKGSRVSGIVGTHRDVTHLVSQSEEIKKQLANVELERERWHAVFDSVDEAILILNRDECINDSNPASEIIIGTGREEILGRRFEDVFDLTNDRGLKLRGELSPIKTVLTTKEPLEYLQAKFTNFEGREIWVGFSFTPIRKSTGDQADDQVIAVCRDISRLVELDRAKSDFVSMASHELRTPLTVINGYISLFSSGELGDIDRPDLAHYKMVLTQIQRSTQRLNNLVEDLLDVSRIEQGRLTLNLIQLNLAQLIEEVIEEMKVRAVSKQHALLVSNVNSSILDLPLLVAADSEKLRQIMINLIDNAIKYTPDEGIIDVSFRRSGKEAVVSISDSGVGIPKNLLSRIFEKFQRLEGSYVKDSQGTGLGLYIVKELVKAHGGRIWVDSRVGEGSVFSFSLPIYPGKLLV
jgi:PAS domain S-box-containing protein